MNVFVNIQGDAVFMRKLKKLPALFEDFRDAFKKIGEDIVDYSSGATFDDMGGNLGTPWQQLSASTIAFKAKHYNEYQAVPLMRTGTMRDSFTYEATEKQVTISNTADYFKYHQSTLPRSKIPRRPMFAINGDVKKIIKSAIKEAVELKIAGL